MHKLFEKFLVVFTFSWIGVADAVPITAADIIDVDGASWAQVDLFQGLSWNDVNAVCPNGQCKDGGMLNGYKMTNWLWAGTDDVNALFNYYIGDTKMGPGPDRFWGRLETFASSFFEDGWRVTQRLEPGASMETIGIMSDDTRNVGIMGAHTTFGSFTFTNYDWTDVDSQVTLPGAWFYRSASEPISTPATFTLMGIAIAVLGFARQKCKIHG